MRRLTRFVNEAAQEDGEILFIAERHLLTFGLIPEAPLFPDYERVFLMEMAMSGNPSYLGRFHEDLRNQRFSLIISAPMFTRLKGPEDVFGEENNAWVQNVSEPVLCYYQPHKRIREIGLQTLIPREDGKDCETQQGGQE